MVRVRTNIIMATSFCQTWYHVLSAVQWYYAACGLRIGGILACVLRVRPPFAAVGTCFSTVCFSLGVPRYDVIDSTTLCVTCVVSGAYMELYIPVYKKQQYKARE